MSSAIKIKYLTTEIDTTTPKWGYATRIELPISITKLDNGKYIKWDNGANYDKRYCSCSLFMKIADMDNIIDIFKNSAKGRGLAVTLELGTNSGFYPFGADKGDSGDFISILTAINPMSSIGHPADLMQCDCTFLFVGSYPAYVIPAAFAEGNLSIGTVSGLRYPENMHVQNVVYKTQTIITENASAYINDKSSAADVYEATLELELLHTNMAALLDYLTGVSGRASNIDIVPPANAYLFGVENGSTATYTCTWLDTAIEIIHNEYNQFITTLNFNLVSAA